MLSCDNMCFHKLSCLIMSYHVLSCLIMSYHVLSRLIMSYHGFHMLSCDNMCFLMCFWLSSHHPLVSWLSSHPSLVSWLSSHHTTQVSNVSCGCPATIFSHPPQKKSQRSQFLILPWGYFPNKIPRDPSFYQYLGGPSTKKIPEIPVFTTTLGSLPQKNPRDTSF